MHALAPAPVTTLAPATGIDLPPVAFVGRSLAEYSQFFALDLVALRGRDVLDVAAGPSSFAAEACARKIDAVAVDPIYGRPADIVAAQVQRDYERMAAEMRTNRRQHRLRAFSSVAAAELDRRAAAQRFLNDYATHFVHGRYVSASLPRLPFFDGTFDLVLCANLLFGETKRFDFDWHLAACRELVRVSAGDVRLHPLGAGDGKPYPPLARLRRELRSEGIASEIVGVDYEFAIGSASMLVLRRNGS